MFNTYGPNPGNLQDAINFYQKIVRKLIFEEVRSDFFPMLPSRKRCLWVIPPNKKAIEFWKKRLKSDESGRILLRLRLKGKIHEASQKYITDHYGNLNVHRDLAFIYWNGVFGDLEEESEYLFEGVAKVIDVIHI